MNNKNQFVTIWMFAGMLLGLAIACVIGISQGKLGMMDVALICRALGDSNRLQIVQMLSDGEKCACIRS
ncbi:hypothetical protein [Bacilliculturomica massiliensis]|uniref:hypothetical protein n=1 Tax=Bacilliculturomica massiliensis TaxID=1917867 RepID=UPI001FE96D0C|nr:hypothetical protein [Bacilliculturomica massiliensis]